jgi:hypothetical protein
MAKARHHSISLHLVDNDHFKRLSDPIDGNTYHAELFLPFREAAKLVPGNANVRPASETRKPFKEMIETAEQSPATFHLKNRGITYLCDRFEFENAKRQITITVPNLAQGTDEDAPRFGIADGGHTFRVIQRVVGQYQDLSQEEDWQEPYVRVHLLSGEGSAEAVEDIVEALNTSSQVQQYTLDEYQNKFDELKEALSKAGFDVSLISFRENEEKEWHVIEIIQRLACFLKDRWTDTHPASMYKSKTKALELYTNDSTRAEFQRLYGVIKEVITLPEYIQSRFSVGGLVVAKSFGKLRCVKPIRQHGKKAAYRRPGTDFETEHKMDLAALLPMAAAFRELLVLKNDRYSWRLHPQKVFDACAEPLHNALVSRSAKVRIASHLGTDMEYWGACSQIVMRAVMEELMNSRR